MRQVHALVVLEVPVMSFDEETTSIDDALADAGRRGCSLSDILCCIAMVMEAGEETASEFITVDSYVSDE